MRGGEIGGGVLLATVDDGNESRIELVAVSATALAQKPTAALRASVLAAEPGDSGARAASRLYVPYQK